MKKSLGLIFVFLIGVSITVAYQNCGNSAVRAASDNEGGIPVNVQPINGGPDETGNDVDPNAPDVFAVGQGANTLFKTTSTTTEVLSTVRYLQKIYYAMFETTIYEAPSVQFTRDLPSAYCDNSALPHCAHMNPFVCNVPGCLQGPTPVRCHWQKRIGTAEEGSLTQAFGNLSIVDRLVTSSDPVIAGCNDPILSFHKEGVDLEVSLADRGCVPDGMKYGQNNSGNALSAIFDAEIGEVAPGTPNDASETEICNNFAAYAWDTTKWSYRSSGGFVGAADRYFFEADYEGQFINLRFKEAGDDTIYCVDRIQVEEGIELNTFFPEEGLRYSIFRANGTFETLTPAEITFEDPADGGAVWRFFMDPDSALANSGGAILEETQANAIKTMIETTIVNEVKAAGAQACPPES